MPLSAFQPPSPHRVDLLRLSLGDKNRPATSSVTVLTLTRLALGEASSARFTTPVFDSAG
jgi:hypothetical protein